VPKTQLPIFKHKRSSEYCGVSKHQFIFFQHN
jgi:hypothetical protein